MINKISKKAQSEVITTVLMILIGIAAVVIVSAFVIDLVRTNLKGTECFETTGQIKLDLDNTYYYKNITSNYSLVYFSVAREMKDFNLSGIILTFGNDISTKSIKITGLKTDNIFHVDPNGVLSETLEFPEQGETKLYVLNSSKYSLGDITRLSIAPIINKGTTCDVVDDKKIQTRASS